MLVQSCFFSDGYPASQESGRRFFRALVLFQFDTKTPVRMEPGLFSREVIADWKAAGNLED
jgi:hypothetical protein